MTTSASTASLRLAHGAQEGGVEWEFLLMGAFLVGAAFVVYRAGGTQRWVPPVLALIGVVLLTGGFVVPRLDSGGEASSTATVDILRPAAGAKIPAGEPFTVEVAVNNGDLAQSPSDEDGGHLHLYVDEKLEQMPYGNEMEVSLTSGTHEITVEYVDHEHRKFDPRILETIELRAE